MGKHLGIVMLLALAQIAWVSVPRLPLPAKSAPNYYYITYLPVLTRPVVF